MWQGDRNLGLVADLVRRMAGTDGVVARVHSMLDLVRDAVGADARLIEATGLKVQEAALTGESAATVKSATALSGEVALADRGASRRHAQIRLKDGTATLTDLGSTNGTEVNGHSVQTAELDDGDRITIGTTVLVFRRGEA